MELGQIEAFVEAQRRGSITRAAAALELTQPTLTARLRGLEQELGAQLLVRGRRGVSLTAAGRRFLPRAQSALEAVRRGVAETKAAREGRGGVLALGLATDLALYIAPTALARFARAHPDVEISVRSGRSHAVAEALRADEIEIALVSQLVALPELASRPLFEESVPALAGLGAAFLPQMAIHDELRRGDLVALRVEGHPAPKRTIHVMTRAGAEVSPTANALLRVLPRPS